jgi:hypothetical protein
LTRSGVLGRVRIRSVAAADRLQVVVADYNPASRRLQRTSTSRRFLSTSMLAVSDLLSDHVVSEKTRMYRHLLIPVDGSDASKAGLREVVRFAAPNGQRRRGSLSRVSGLRTPSPCCLHKRDGGQISRGDPIRPNSLLYTFRRPAIRRPRSLAANSRITPVKARIAAAKWR